MCCLPLLAKMQYCRQISTDISPLLCCRVYNRLQWPAGGDRCIFWHTNNIKVDCWSTRKDKKRKKTVKRRDTEQNCVFERLCTVTTWRLTKTASLRFFYTSGQTSWCGRWHSDSRFVQRRFYGQNSNFHQHLVKNSTGLSNRKLNKLSISFSSSRCIPCAS